jgi:hypothetical protein
MGIDARSAGRMLALVGKHMADAGRTSIAQSSLLYGGSACDGAARGSKVRLAQMDPLRIGGPDSALVAPHSWRHWCS